VNARLKACNLLWHICRGCVPIRARLLTQYVPCSDICPLHVNASKDGRDAFVRCDIVQE